eukprot:scaffold1197_cov228-Pinguiococcus_pyrenoidosus.AAC.3
MDTLQGPEAQLLYFASLLPKHERAMCKGGFRFLRPPSSPTLTPGPDPVEMILDGDPGLLDALQTATGEDRDSFKASALGAVIERVVEHAYQVYDRIFEDMDVDVGKKLAEKGKDRLSADQQGPALVYGEIDFFSFATLLEKAQPAPGETFVDLGSGTGKAVVAAALLYGHKFSRCAGIEIVPSLYEASLIATARYEEEDRKIAAFYAEERAELRWYCGDILDENQVDEQAGLSWTADGDVVFVNATCFPTELMDKVTAQAETLKQGARVITLTKALNSSEFELLERKQYAMSWGPATAFIQIRK